MVVSASEPEPAILKADPQDPPVPPASESSTPRCRFVPRWGQHLEIYFARETEGGGWCPIGDYGRSVAERRDPLPISPWTRRAGRQSFSNLPQVILRPW